MPPPSARPSPEDRLPEITQVLALMQNPDEITAFLQDLLSPAELRAVCERWAVVRALADGMTQRAVRDHVGASIATVSRGNRVLKHGSGGFDRALWLARAWTGGS